MPGRGYNWLKQHSTQIGAVQVWLGIKQCNFATGVLLAKLCASPPSVDEKAIPFLCLFRLNQPFCNSTRLRWDNPLLLLVTRVTTPPLKGWCDAHQNCVFSWNGPSSGAPPTQTSRHFGRPFNRLNGELFGLKLEVGAPVSLHDLHV